MPSAGQFRPSLRRLGRTATVLALAIGSLTFSATLPAAGAEAATGTVVSRTGWSVSASVSGSDAPANMIDGNAATRWSTGTAMAAGQFVTVDMGTARSISEITMDSSGSTGDYARGYQVYLSTDGTTWGTAVATGNGSTQLLDVTFTARNARYIKVVQTGSAGSWWSIHEFNAYVSGTTTPSAAAAANGAASMMTAYDAPTGLISVDGWWNAAVALSTEETYQQVTGDTQYSYAIGGAWDKNHQNNFETDALDDTLWWAVAMIQAYDVTGDVKYLQTAQAATTYVHGYWDSTCGGGVWWSTARTYKNAITNELFLQSAAALHNRVAGDTVDLAWAKDNAATGLAVNGQSEGMYMVASGTHVNTGCCFDYGNAETNTLDTGNGHMDTVNLTTFCGFGPCTGSGPWVEADLENGQYLGANGNNPANLGNNSNFVTALLKNDGQTQYALKGGNSTSGGLSTWWEGSLPNRGGYIPMKQEGAIVLGTGGDNSNWSVGSYFEGVITRGYPTTAADNAVQANIVAVGYAGPSNGNGSTAGTIGGPGGQCVDVGGDDLGVDLAPVQLWNCLPAAVDQHWTHNSDQSISTLGRCLDIEHNGTANGALVELWDCNGVGGQKWVQQADGSLRNPQSGRCLDSPGGSTTNGVRLEIWDCNGTAGQKFAVNGGAPIASPGGKCLDLAGDDVGVNGTAVQLWDCQSYAADQHWALRADGSVRTLGRCLDVTGGATGNGALVEIWDCTGGGNQTWTQQADGSLRNSLSGRCLDSPGGSTTNGVRLEIWDCNGTAAQKFALS